MQINGADPMKSRTDALPSGLSIAALERIASALFAVLLLMGGYAVSELVAAWIGA